MISGLVVTHTRRSAEVKTDAGILHTRLKGDIEPITIGDAVEIDNSTGSDFISIILPRKNIIMRRLLGKQKLIASNIDALIILTAPAPLLNTFFIDRVLATAHSQGIAAKLVCNKCDLDLTASDEIFKVYELLGIEIIYFSVKKDINVSAIEDIISQNKITLITGISGVGKSSTIKKLLPDAISRIGEVSEKTGLGKQTTAQSFAYRTNDGKYVIDCPGIQSFGVAHLTLQDVANSMPEISAASLKCKFQDCKHINEPECGVKTALEAGTITKWRYESYLDMLQEIKNEEPFWWGEKK